MLDEGADLDIVEVVLVDKGRDNGSPAIPGNAQFGVFFVDISRPRGGSGSYDVCYICKCSLDEGAY